MEEVDQFCLMYPCLGLVWEEDLIFCSEQGHFLWDPWSRPQIILLLGLTLKYFPLPSHHHQTGLTTVISHSPVVLGD
jgi:hypothetical protein